MKIVVLCGGISTERDVSITSGSCVAKALRERGHSVALVDAFLGYEGKDFDSLFESGVGGDIRPVGENAPDIEKIKSARGGDICSVGKNVIQICRTADIVFLALHGDTGENGKMQALLDIYGVKYTGSGYLGSALAMNKGLSKKLFLQAGIPTPASICLKKGDRRDVGFPCVVKPCSGGSSVGTSIVRDPAEYDAALDFAFKYESDVIVEQYIKGRELTVGVFNGKALPCIEIIPKTGFYDYKNKYQAGLTEEICPAQITEKQTSEIGRLAERVCECLMIDVYCRVDFMMGENGEMYCLEANTLPGMTPTSLIPQMVAAVGIGFGEFCEKIIEASLKKYN